MNKLAKSKKTGLFKSRIPIPPTRVEVSKKHKKEKHKKNFRDLIPEDSSSFIIYKFVILDKNFNPIHYAWGYDEEDARKLVRELFPEFITINGKVLNDKDLYFVQTLEYKII